MSKETALITDTTGGLGMEFVKIHAQKGGNLVLVGRNPQKLAQLKYDITNKYHIKVMAIAVDFTQFW